MTSISNRAHITGKDYKNLNHITCLNCNKNGHYISIYTKLRKDFNTLND